jgi:hypothetical protein
MTDWPKIRLLQARLRWHRSLLGPDRRKLLMYKATGDREHYWLNKHLKEGNHKAAAINEAEIRKTRPFVAKWTGICNAHELEIHRLEVAIRALLPKTQLWPLGGLVAPGERYREQRWDQGKDFEIPLGASVRAPGNGHCVEWASDRPWPDGFGTPYAIVRFSSGPFHDIPVSRGAEPEWYVGHCNDPIVRPGEFFSVGHPLARTDHSENAGWGWCEFGHWSPGSMSEGERWADCYRTVRR